MPAMDYVSVKFALWATGLGALSAVSLPLGSAVGLSTRPRPIIISVLAAFGAGALVAALSVELVAPTLFALEGDSPAHGPGDPHLNFYALVTGAMVGGILYFLLDQVVNARGGFLRKTATTVAYFGVHRRGRERKLLEELSRFPLLCDVPPHHISTLVKRVHPVAFNDGDAVGSQGDDVGELILVLEGTVQVTRDGEPVTEFGPGAVTGLMSLVMDIPSPGAGTARGPVAGLALAASDFEHLRHISPEFDRACRELSAERLQATSDLVTAKHHASTQWLRQAGHALRTGVDLPDTSQLRKAKDEHQGAPLAIWLGMVIDGIPESFVIGAGMLVVLKAMGTDISFGSVIPYTLVAGLFLSNFPEALASSANMRLQGWGKPRIFMLWVSLMMITSVGAGFGFVLADSLNPTWLAFAEGVAAGAMLTMIAAAMIPEAVHMGNANAVGLSTLAGFLAAISFKLLE